MLSTGYLRITSKEPPPASTEGGRFKKAVSILKRLFQQFHHSSDHFVFYFCIALFFIGGIVLKYGEKQEEGIRQKALGLKSRYERNLFLFYYEVGLLGKGYTREDLNNILERYPNEFIRDANLFICVDSTVKANVTRQVFVLLDNYIETSLRHKNRLNLQKLYVTDDKFVDNVRYLFSGDIVKMFLAQPAIAAKYSIEDDGGEMYVRKK
ncbi:hypothetical protein [Chitinophaga agri]|uniref:Uncharacterized protein n=1 Tax=Chitinophaga agri TaxID=2703787 RepID=A0A6B9Z8I7_9BACT|nr:hypothetical protein [Chitinophaga agri]QHS58317.1 hypothetical protein GWR21_01525 [Chitinophaga agri]